MARGGWKRIKECFLCGNPRCVVSLRNERMAYCFRFSQVFFLNSDGNVLEKGCGEKTFTKGFSPLQKEIKFEDKSLFDYDFDDQKSFT